VQLPDGDRPEICGMMAAGCLVTEAWTGVAARTESSPVCGCHMPIPPWGGSRVPGALDGIPDAEVLAAWAACGVDQCADTWSAGGSVRQLDRSGGCRAQAAAVSNPGGA